VTTLDAERARVAERYRGFALEARGESAVYEEWATGVAGDDRLVAAIAGLPAQKRQPYLLFAVSRLLGAPVAGFARWRAWVLHNWAELAAEASVRHTQTNEPLRCAALLPALALIPGPLALLEVGASAGLCLYPDRYSYRYDGGEPLHPLDGPSTVMLESTTSGGVPVPRVLPDVVWRAGIDLEPLDVSSRGDAMWLETLVWPGQNERLDRVRRAARIAREDPPLLVRGDVTDALAPLAARAPADATLVVVSSGVLVYVPRVERQCFALAVDALEARWLSLEAAGLLERVVASIQAVTDATTDDLAGRFALALDAEALAFVAPHGQQIDWIAAPHATATAAPI
jgi:hypothetical protein